MADQVDVKIVVQPDGAEAGAQQASASIQKAASSMEMSLNALRRTVSATALEARKSMQATADATKGANAAISAMASSAQAAAAQINGAFNTTAAGATRAGSAVAGLGHSSTAARREMIVLAHELMTGNFTRFEGSLLVLAERMQLLRYVTGATMGTVALLGAAVAAFAMAAYKGSKELHELQNELILTGNAGALTAQRWQDLAGAIEDANGRITRAQARGAVTATAGTGVFGPQAMSHISAAVAEISRLSGETAKKVADDFAKMDEGVYKWATTNKDAKNLISAADAEYARTLEEQGKKEEAEIFIADRISAKLKQMASDVGSLASKWEGVRKAAADAFDEMSRAWQADGTSNAIGTIDDEIARIEKAKKGFLGSYTNKEDDAYLASLKARRDALVETQKLQQKQADRDAEIAKNAREGKAASAELHKLTDATHGAASAQENYNKKVAEYTELIAKAKAGGGYVPSAKEQAEHMKQLAEERDRQSKPKGAGGPASPAAYRAGDDAAANADLALIKDKLKFEQQELETAYRAKEIDLQRYFDTRRRITKEGMDLEIAEQEKRLGAAQGAQAHARSQGQRMQAAAQITTEQGKLNLLKQQQLEEDKKLTQEQEVQTRLLQQRVTAANAEATKRGADAAIASKEAVSKAEYAMGQMSYKQLEELELQYEAARYKIALDALNQRNALRKMDAADQAEANAEKLGLWEQYQAKVQTIVLQGAEQANQTNKQMTQQIENDFSNLFDELVSKPRQAGVAFRNFFNAIDQQLTKLMSQKFMESVLGGGTSGGGASNLISKGLAYLGIGAPGTTNATGPAGGSGNSGGLLGSLLSKAGLGGGDQLAKTTESLNVMTAQATTLTTAGATMANVQVAMMTVASMVGAGGGGGGGGLGSLLGGLGSGSEGGAFGFTDASTAGSTSAVMSGAMMDSSSSGMSALMGLAPAYAKGTNYVPETGLALLHKGEAVVPAQYNTGGSNNTQANVVNKFYLTQQTDLRTQSQIASAAGQSIQTALRRNG